VSNKPTTRVCGVCCENKKKKKKKPTSKRLGTLKEQMRRPGSMRSRRRPCMVKRSKNLRGSPSIVDAFLFPPFSRYLFTASNSILSLSTPESVDTHWNLRFSLSLSCATKPIDIHIYIFYRYSETKLQQSKTM
jgi:hypothetical protein